MKYLGIDYGTKRIGLALSDIEGRMAFPHAIIPAGKTAVTDLATLCTKEGVGMIIVGDSRDLMNGENPVMKKIRPFAEELRVATGLPLAFMNEVFSSREATHMRGDDKDNDASAAAIVLQSYLDMDGVRNAKHQDE